MLVQLAYWPDSFPHSFWNWNNLNSEIIISSTNKSFPSWSLSYYRLYIQMKDMYLIDLFFTFYWYVLQYFTIIKYLQYDCSAGLDPKLSLTFSHMIGMSNILLVRALQRVEWKSMFQSHVLLHICPCNYQFPSSK